MNLIVAFVLDNNYATSAASGVRERRDVSLFLPFSRELFSPKVTEMLKVSQTLEQERPYLRAVTSWLKNLWKKILAFYFRQEGHIASSLLLLIGKFCDPWESFRQVSAETLKKMRCVIALDNLLSGVQSDQFRSLGDELFRCSWHRSLSIFQRHQELNCHQSNIMIVIPTATVGWFKTKIKDSCEPHISNVVAIWCEQNGHTHIILKHAASSAACM